MNKQINKEDVLRNIDTYQVINHYLKPFHQKAILRQGQHISNPFLPEPQKTPSFNIYESKGMWRFKDFATDDDGDIFDLIKRIHHCDFREALNILSQDFVISLSDSGKKSFTLYKSEWNPSTLSYWLQYDIQKEHLKLFNVYPIIKFIRHNKNNQTIQSGNNNPIFAYNIGVDCYKIYCPLSTKFKFSWLGNKTGEYVFGRKQLPPTGKIVFITGGEKDVLSLHAHNQHAICLNSETTFPSELLIRELKQRFKNVVLLYDIDSTGNSQSQKIAQRFGLQRMILPEKLLNKGGKDISDFFKLGFKLNDPDLKLEDYSSKENTDQYLSILLQTQKTLTQRKSETIAKTQPILTQNDQGVIFPRTINIIQGKAGVHKSRLAETFCSAFIKHPQCKNKLLGFKTNILTRPTVCYVDTERNLTEQFPLALQQILQKGGYTKEETPYHFDYISLLEVPRKDRFKALTEYLGYVRKKFDGHLVIVLDVVTDCIKDFNRSEDSMQLIDLMNESINKYNVTFIGLIHENPGSIDKARGHLGTELMNKSSTVIQVGFEKGKNGKPTDLIALNFLKTRSTKRFESMYLKYCNETKGLVIADHSSIADVIQSRQLKAEIPELMEFLIENLSEPTPNKTLIEMLSTEFDCSSKIIRRRLKDILDKQLELTDEQNNRFQLTKKQQGKEIIYALQALNGKME